MNFSFFISHFSLLFSHLKEGGYVIYPLLGISVWMWYLIIKKMREISYWRKQRGSVSQKGEAHEIMAEFETKKTFEPEYDKKLLQSLVQKRQNDLERHIQTIFVLASVAPLLGLLGTVTGMISTFEAISRFGTANTRALAAGISEALITTQIGLVVAVPGLFMGHIIRRRTDDLENRIESWKLKREIYLEQASHKAQ
ncbi:MAG: MotA/TolQ/ExbB proton channel family protein [Desulfobacteraceae bacterium]|nr:MotA/TolQ/ExbB proton channel family protein [Desulfobacteraceae bacterium]